MSADDTHVVHPVAPAPIQGGGLRRHVESRRSANPPGRRVAEPLIHGLNVLVVGADGRRHLSTDAVTRVEDFGRLKPRLAGWRAVLLFGDPA